MHESQVHLFHWMKTETDIVLPHLLQASMRNQRTLTGAPQAHIRWSIFLNARFIPASAGNTLHHGFSIPSKTVHPRVRVER